MDVVLVHGQGRGPASLLVLAWRLRRRGHRVHLFRYRVRRETFAAIVARFVAWLPARVGAHPYVLVGHSLGSIVARASLPLLTTHPPCHLVMLAPPNQSSLLARRLQHHPLYRALTGDCGQRLADPAFAAAASRPARAARPGRVPAHAPTRRPSAPPRT
jgi:pimeloyl-ACP methyl ester carboxylesterase